MQEHYKKEHEMKKGRVMLMIAVKYLFLLIIGGLFNTCCAQTSDLRGNWRKKSEWRAESQQEVAAIPPLVAKILADRAQFDQKVATIRELLADFYQHQKIDATTTSTLIADIKQYLDKTRQGLITDTVVNDEDDEVAVNTDVVLLDEKKELVEKLGSLLQDLQQAEPTIAGYIKKYDEIEQQAQAAIAKSQSLFNEIDTMLDHVRAEGQYYAINALKETLLKQIEYLEGIFTSSLDALRDTLADRISQAEGLIVQLESENIFVQDRAARVVAEKERQAELEREIAEQEAQRERSKKPWYTQLFEKITDFFSGLFSRKKPVITIVVTDNASEGAAQDLALTHEEATLPDNKE